METILKDLRYGLRIMLRNPGFTAVALLAITLGIAANTTTFSAIDATLFHPFNFPNEQRLVMLWERGLEQGYRRGSASSGNAIDWKEQNQTLEGLSIINQRSFDLTENDEPERFFGYLVSANFFDILGARTLYGRTFVAEEGEPGKDQVVVLKHNLWQRRFASDPNIINQTIRMNGRSYTVIGVMPPDFNYPFNGGELWAPLVSDAKDVTNRGSTYLQGLGLLKTEESS